jgi:hypothetical protein
MEKKPETWQVDVHADGVVILSIGSGYLSGIKDIADFADTVRNCADHLMSFIGPDLASVALDEIGSANIKEIGQYLEDQARIVAENVGLAEQITLLSASLAVCQRNEADLRGEIERLKGWGKANADLASLYGNDAKTATLRAERLEKALVEFGKHKDACFHVRKFLGNPNFCNCGLTEALAAEKGDK